MSKSRFGQVVKMCRDRPHPGTCRQIFADTRKCLDRAATSTRAARDCSFRCDAFAQNASRVHMVTCAVGIVRQGGAYGR